MRHIIILIAGVLFSVSATAQEIPESDVISATMPVGAKHLTKQQVEDNIHRDYRESEIRSNRKNIYQLDGLIISFWDLSVDPAFKKSLQKLQTEMLAYMHRDSVSLIHFSKIIIVNNIQFLVYEYERNDTYFLRFQSEYNKNDRNICGLIQFKKPDEDKAEKALKDLLQSMHFKN